MSTVQVRNLRDHDVTFHELHVDGERCWLGNELEVAAGDVVDVSYETAHGSLAHGRGGLLDQTDNWELVEAAKKPKPKPKPKPAVVTEDPPETDPAGDNATENGA